MAKYCVKVTYTETDSFTVFVEAATSWEAEFAAREKALAMNDQAIGSGTPTKRWIPSIGNISTHIKEILEYEGLDREQG